MIYLPPLDTLETALGGVIFAGIPTYFDFAALCLDVVPEAMKAKSRKPLSYPDQTRGSKLAAEIRKKANGLTFKQRDEYFRKGMAMTWER